MKTINLLGDNAIEIGASYSAGFRVCSNSDPGAAFLDLTQYTGQCQIRASVGSAILLSPVVTVISPNIFNLTVAYDAYASDLSAGTYLYDVRFSKTGHRFYIVEGKVQILKRITVTV